MPERLLREPWRLALFFVAVFGLMIVCTGVLVWQQTKGNLDTQRTLNQARKNYESGEQARGQLMVMVAEEKRMNECLIKMNKQEIAYQREVVKILRRLEKRRR